MTPETVRRPKNSRKKWAVLAAGTAGLVAVLGSVATAGGSHTMTGTFTLTDFDRNFESTPTNCKGSGGYEDLGPGASVTVYDQTNKVIGSGHVDSSRALDRASCEMDFEVSDLPDADFYQVEIAHRGKVTVEPEELGLVSLSIGD